MDTNIKKDTLKKIITQKHPIVNSINDFDNLVNNIMNNKEECKFLSEKNIAYNDVLFTTSLSFQCISKSTGRKYNFKDNITNIDNYCDSYAKMSYDTLMLKGMKSNVDIVRNVIILSDKYKNVSINTIYVTILNTMQTKQENIDRVISNKDKYIGVISVGCEKKIKNK